MDSLNTYTVVTFVTILFVVVLLRITIHLYTVKKVLSVADVADVLHYKVRLDASRSLNGYAITSVIFYLVALGLILSGYINKLPLIFFEMIPVFLLTLFACFIIAVQLRFNDAIKSIGWAKDLQRDCEVHEGFVVQVISNDNKPSQIFIETGDIVESRIKEFITEDDVSDFYIKWGEPEDRDVIIYSSLNHEGESVIHHLILDEEDSTFVLLYD